uniref:Cytochrome c oxidase assembly factor 1 n=1 Tax=Leptobrachium leishanense TaxID=445787 RepID=A0A8C5MGH9_9ANUR
MERALAYCLQSCDSIFQNKTLFKASIKTTSFHTLRAADERMNICVFVFPGKMPIPLKNLQQLAIYVTVVSGGGCGLMYYFMQKTFAKKEYYMSAIEKLNSKADALDVLGAPPLKIHYLRLTDKYNLVNPSAAQIKIPVSGTISAGYLYVKSDRDSLNKRWTLKDVTLKLNTGQEIPVYQPGDEEKEELQELEIVNSL